MRNYPDGAPVKFDVYDLSGDKPFLMKTLSGKNEGGKAEVEWEVEVSSKSQSEDGELRIGFEGYARSKYSERKEIGVREKKEEEYILLEFVYPENVREDKVH
ncbi:MAG: hypothetical protein N2053_01770, partial [Chitinispirillaceae bacterium]|nr:hypothetical protein [Chitinispirillaceae bacterium]